MMADNIVSPYFFEDDNQNAVTVTGECYRAITKIRDFLRPHIGNVSGLWFHQDGATAHTAQETMDLSTDCFDDRINS